MSEAIDLGAVRSGFRNPALEGQQLFRHILEALSRPGRVQDLSMAPEPPTGLTRAAGAVALTLLDFETRVWLDPTLRDTEAEAWLRFHCNCPLTPEPAEAAFALVASGSMLPRLDTFARGDARYPDRSTTLIVQVPSLHGGPMTTLEGPGIEHTESVDPTGLPADFWSQIVTNGCDFQLGVDLLLVADESILGLPRTVRVVGA